MRNRLSKHVSKSKFATAMIGAVLMFFVATPFVAVAVFVIESL